MRAFLRQGKFAPQHSEMEDFLTGRITRQQGMFHIREAVRPSVRSTGKLRKETLECLRAWDLVYLDRLAVSRLVPGEKTAASEPLHGLSANEALLMRQAHSRRLLRRLPPIILKSLQARMKKMEAAWARDGKQYDQFFPEAAPPPRRPEKKRGAASARTKGAAKKARAADGKKKARTGAISRGAGHPAWAGAGRVSKKGRAQRAAGRRPPRSGASR